MNLQNQPNKKKLLFAFVGVSLLGFADAFYLTVHHFQNSSVVCTVVRGCDTVLQSQYAAIAGVPVAVLGVIFYLSLIFLSVAFLDTQKTRFLKVLVILTTLGLLSTLWFLYVQAVLLEAYCLYCLISAGTSCVLFLLSLGILKEQRKEPVPQT